jgi:hypothetical protein
VKKEAKRRDRCNEGRRLIEAEDGRSSHLIREEGET